MTVLAITGIYAVVMYSVSQRGREIGIRLVLGATRTNIVRLVVGRGLLFVLIGLAVGTTAALGATRLMSTMLFGLAATDVATFSEVAILVAALSVVACALPTIWTGRSLVSVLQAE